MTKNLSLKRKADENQNQITSLKRKLKKDFTINSLEEAGTDPAKLWQLYNQLIGNHQPTEDIEPEAMTQEKANQYNDFFLQNWTEYQKPTSKIASPKYS